MRDSFVFYRSFYEAIKDLPDEQFAACARALMAYALDDQEPDGDGIAQVVFQLAKPQIDTNNKRFENGRKGGRPKNQTETKPKPNNNQTITKPEPNVNVNENVNVHTPKGVCKRFTPPTPEQVSEYCAEKGYAIDAEKFVDFYESKGWMVGKNKMKDWKSAVRNWNRTDKERQDKATKPDKFNNFDNNSYDVDAIERRLVQGGQ